MGDYWCKRCYLRGTSWLGLLNTVLGCLFNRVLVLKISGIGKCRKVTGWWIDKATDWPKKL